MGAPKPPDPAKTSTAQLGYSKDAATYQNELNQVNQVTPTGSLTYEKIGTNPDGSPIMRATSALNASQQGLLNAQTAGATGAANAATGIVGANAGRWAAGPNMDETGVTKAIMGWGGQYLEPIFKAQAATERARLANQGIAPGSEAYNASEMSRSRNNNDAYTKLLLEGQGQAMSMAEANYMDPLRALSALATGQQPSINYAQTPQAGVQTPDYSGAAQSEYQAKAANYGNMMSGLFKIPSTLLGGWASGGM